MSTTTTATTDGISYNAAYLIDNGSRFGDGFRCNIGRFAVFFLVFDKTVYVANLNIHISR